MAQSLLSQPLLLSGSLQKTKYLYLPDNQSMIKVSSREIVHMEGIRNYTVVYLKDGKQLLSARTLKTYEKELVDLDFVRVHKSHLINLNYLVSYDMENATFLKLKDQKQVLISRRKRKSFQERLHSFEWANN